MKKNWILPVLVSGLLVACANVDYGKIKEEDIVFKTKIVDSYDGIITDKQIAHIIDDNNFNIATMHLESLEKKSEHNKVDYCIYQHPEYQGKSFVIGNIFDENVSYVNFADKNKIEVHSFENFRFFFKVANSTNLSKNYYLYDETGKLIESNVHYK